MILGVDYTPFWTALAVTASLACSTWGVIATLTYFAKRSDRDQDADQVASFVIAMTCFAVALVLAGGSVIVSRG